MPIREYRCARCHAEFEELVFGDNTPPCSACGSHTVQPLISRCCVHGGNGGDSGDFGMPSGSSSGGCSGCAGGNCGSCH